MGKKHPEQMSVEEIAARAGTTVAVATWSLTKTFGKAVKCVAWDNGVLAVMTVAMDKHKPGAPK